MTRTVVFLLILSVLIITVFVGYSFTRKSRDDAKQPPFADQGTEQAPVRPEEEKEPEKETNPAEEAGPEEEKGPEEETSSEKEIDPAMEKTKSMTLDEKIGQMFMVGLEGYAVDEYAIKMLEDYKVGGFILFGRNIRDSWQALELINSLKEANRGNKVPLFVSVDEEGGRVSRMPEEFNDLPASGEIGKAKDESYSFEIGKIIAEEIKALGFNMNFAPVLDINSNPDNPVIGDRSFGADPETVSKLGVQAMKGMQSEMIIPVVKHFPGHGDTSADSHTTLPRVENDMERLKSFELIPFKEAIDNGADAVMVAHILLSEIDPENPASLSGIVINDILRGYLGFEGVVITDDMTMGAITGNYEIGEAVVKSVKAGTDILLVCHGYDMETDAINALKAAVARGDITEDRINESVYRILELKRKYALADDVIDTVRVEKINQRIDEVLGRH